MKRIHGTSRRTRVLVVPLALVVVLALSFVVAASAAHPGYGTFSTLADQGGANDNPNQKDLTEQGTNTSFLSDGVLWVLFNWDDQSVSGNNTLDACTLFDTDAAITPGNTDFAVCLTLKRDGSSLAQKSLTVYTCGDTRNDRCSQPVTSVPIGSTFCELEFNATNPFDFGANDTRAYCSIDLSAVGATSARLINTCSYPSAEPNSDPSDCVVIPGKANPGATTAPFVIPNDTATVSNWASGGTGGTLTFYLYNDSSCSTQAWASQAITVTGNSTYSSGNAGDASSTPPGFRITTSNDSTTYYWKVIYSGDTKNNGFTTTCGSTGETTSVTIAP